MPTDAELRALVRLDVEVSTLRDCADELEAQAPGSAAMRAALAEFLRGLAHDLEALLRPQEPEQAARERLGRWLAAERNRTWDYSNQTRHRLGAWLVELWNDASPGADPDSRGEGATLADAINAALDAVERSRT